MASTDPVSIWIDELRNADDSAASKIWEHFVRRLHRSAREKLRPETRRVYDEEDAALSAFESFCNGVSAGRFPDLQDRESLWHLLLVITARKVSRRHRFDQQQRRDVRRNLTHSICRNQSQSEESTLGNVDQIPSREPTPEFSAEFVDVCDSLMQRLDDPNLREVAQLRMEQFTDAEIAERMRCSRSTVQRRLEVIRRQWRHLEFNDE